jgi:hypothetical protein
MAVVMMLLGALAFGPACLAFLLWLGHLEETLPQDVRRAQRRPEPPPILAIPVRRTQPTATGPIPEQRTAPAVELSGSESVATP